jgi:CubicO group peptidase (beta-lactamase class C family)
MTVDHLLTHTSGIPGFESVEDFEANKHRYREPEEILSYVKKKKLLFGPGAHYAYSNTGYLVLGMIIERVSRRPYKEAVEHEVLQRIGLRETSVITAETLKALVVRGHHRGKVLTDAEGYVVPFAAGSIAATPRDLVLFFQALMSGKVLSQDRLQEMFTDMNRMTLSQRTYYGRGVVAALDTPVGTIVGHTGGTRGFGASLFYHPGKNVFVCVMMNDDARAVDPAMFRLMEAVLAFEGDPQSPSLRP